MALYSRFKLTVLCALFHEAAAAVRRHSRRHHAPPARVHLPAVALPHGLRRGMHTPMMLEPLL